MCLPLSCLDVKCTLDMNLLSPPASSLPPNFSSSASSKVMKYCPAAAVFTKPALEYNLINWKWSRRFANFRLSSCSKFPCRVSLVRGVSFVVDKSVGITTVSELSSATSLLVLSKTARDSPSQLVTHVRYCSVDTELIDVNNCAKNNFYCFSITTEIHRQCSSSFAWQRSSYKTLGPRNAGCPLSMKLIIMSSAMWFHSPFGLYVTIPSLVQAQDTTNVRARIFSHNLLQFWNSQYTFLRFLFLATQCRCTLTWR